MILKIRHKVGHLSRYIVLILIALGALLAVRTYGNTCVLKIMHSDTPKRIKLVDVATIYPSDVGGRQMIDVKFPSVHDLLTVNDQGMVFSYNLTGGKPFL